MADNATFEMTFGEINETFETTMDQIVEVTINDHSKLENRDLEDQHPISAITELAGSLQIRPSQALTNQEIHNLLKH